MTSAEVEKYINQLAFPVLNFLEKYKIQIKTLLKILVLLVILVLVFILPYGCSTVEIITKSYKDEPAAHWTCDGSPEFTLEPADKTTRGTEIMHIAEDSLEFLEEAKIKELLNKYKFMPVAIKFGTKTEKIEQKGESVDPEDKEETYKTVEVDNI
jgi:molecular chaperone HtpG